MRAERAFLKKLEGGCQVPIAAYAQLIDGKVVMKGLVGSVDGKTLTWHIPRLGLETQLWSYRVRLTENAGQCV